MIGSSSIQPNAKRIATDIFTKLAISEGKVHNIPPEDVEFHEVGAVDSIVDCVGAAIGFDALGIERFMKFYTGFRRHMHVIEVASGALLILLGVLLVFGKFTLLSHYFSFLNRFVL